MTTSRTRTLGALGALTVGSALALGGAALATGGGPQGTPCDEQPRQDRHRHRL